MDDERTDTIESQPEMLTLMEAAAILRIGRTTAYQLAAEYLQSGGTRGLPVVRWADSSVSCGPTLTSS